MEREQRNELWKKIISDVGGKTGLPPRWQFDTSDKKIADVVLPELAAWLARVEDPDIRHMIYGHFLTSHAYPYLDHIVQWWEEETSQLSLDCLAQILARLIKSADATRIWNVFRIKRPVDYHLMAKLSTFPDIGSQVKTAIVTDLRDGRLGIAELNAISHVDDPSIRDWFAAHTFSEVP